MSGLARPSGFLYALLLVMFIAGLVLGFGAGWVAAPRPAPSVEASVQPSQQVAPVTTERTRASHEPDAATTATPYFVTPTGTPLPTLSLTLTGPARWYCNVDPARGPVSRCFDNLTDGPGRDLFAAAGPGLRVGDWRDRQVIVFGPAGYAVVDLVDACGEGCATLIDLYADAWEIICGPDLRIGICEVTVSWQ